MKIGIDIDGVLLNTEILFKIYAEIYDMELGKSGVINNNEWTIEKRYDWDKKELEQYWERYIIKATEESEIMPGAKTILQKLKDEGHILIINTARGIDDGLTTEKLRKEIIDSAKEKFEKENLKFDKYYWGIINKEIPCKQENIDVMIEDSYDNCIKLAKEKIKVLYLRDKVSPIIENNNYVQEVHNWGEIYRYIVEFSKNK